MQKEHDGASEYISLISFHCLLDYHDKFCI